MSVFTRYMSNLGKEHWRVVRWIFRYLRGSSSACLYFGKSGDDLIGYVDSDSSGDLDRRRSLFRLCLYCWRLCCELKSSFTGYCCFVYHRS
jgi:hypothetical protein